MAKEDATGQAVESSMEQLQDINRKQSEIISAQARTIEELRGTIVELNASLAWLKRKVFGKMSEKCKPVDNGDPKLPFDYGDLERIEAEIEEARSRAAEQITVPKSRAANKTPRRNLPSVFSLWASSFFLVVLWSCYRMGRAISITTMNYSVAIFVYSRIIR